MINFSFKGINPGDFTRSYLDKYEFRNNRTYGLVSIKEYLNIRKMRSILGDPRKLDRKTAKKNMKMSREVLNRLEFYYGITPNQVYTYECMEMLMQLALDCMYTNDYNKGDMSMTSYLLGILFPQKYDYIIIGYFYATLVDLKIVKPSDKQLIDGNDVQSLIDRLKNSIKAKEEYRKANGLLPYDRTNPYLINVMKSTNNTVDQTTVGNNSINDAESVDNESTDQPNNNEKDDQE